MLTIALVTYPSWNSNSFIMEYGARNIILSILIYQVHRWMDGWISTVSILQLVLFKVVSIYILLIIMEAFRDQSSWKRCSWAKGTRSTTQFNLPPSNCRRHFTFVSVADGSTQKALGFTWRGIDYTFSSS